MINLIDKNSEIYPSLADINTDNSTKNPNVATPNQLAALKITEHFAPLTNEVKAGSDSQPHLDDIMKKFKSDIEKDSLTEQEAIEHIRKGLDVAQKLLDMRKEYTDKFLKVLTPNQVLKMNRVEKDMMLHLKKYKNKNVVK